jgi:hypothetical protein
LLGILRIHIKIWMSSIRYVNIERWLWALINRIMTTYLYDVYVWLSDQWKGTISCALTNRKKKAHSPFAFANRRRKHTIWPVQLIERMTRQCFAWIVAAAQKVVKSRGL